MGKASRLKKQRAEAKLRPAGSDALARMRQSPGQYVADPGRSRISMIRAAALHETGHAVAALTLNFSLNFVILHVRADGIAGYCETAFKGGKTEAETLAAYNSPEMLRARAIQELAGPAAEWIGQKWIGHADENVAEQDVARGAVDDDQKAVALALQAAGKDGWQEYLSSCSDAAHDLIRQHWRACYAVAQYLIDHPNQQMPGAMVAQFVNELRGDAQ